jgi:hypothetical protein
LTKPAAALAITRVSDCTAFVIGSVFWHYILKQFCLIWSYIIIVCYTSKFYLWKQIFLIYNSISSIWFLHVFIHNSLHLWTITSYNQTVPVSVTATTIMKMVPMIAL